MAPEKPKAANAVTVGAWQKTDKSEKPTPTPQQIQQAQQVQQAQQAQALIASLLGNAGGTPGLPSGMPGSSVNHPNLDPPLPQKNEMQKQNDFLNTAFRAASLAQEDLVGGHYDVVKGVNTSEIGKAGDIFLTKDVLNRLKNV